MTTFKIETLFEPFSQKWLDKSTIFVTLHGSHAYGTNHAGSDIDLRGICIPPKKYFMGYANKFEQAQSNTPYDLTIFDIRKFFKLSADCNPNTLEIIFTDPEDWIRTSDAFGEIWDNRHAFLSKKAEYTFCGYAMSQLKRIKSHRKWLLKPPTHQPTRQEFALTERSIFPKDQIQAVNALVTKQVDSWELDLSDLDPARILYIKEQLYRVVGDLTKEDKDFKAYHTLGFDEDFIRLIQQENQYRAAQKEWGSYQNWINNRNEDRANKEAQYGYDTKHGSHLVRLLTMGLEILTKGEVLVKRPDADLLLLIKEQGVWSYDQLIKWADIQMELIKAASKVSNLPKKPDMELLDSLCVRLVDQYGV